MCTYLLDSSSPCTLWVRAVSTGGGCVCVCVGGGGGDVQGRIKGKGSSRVAMGCPW